MASDPLSKLSREELIERVRRAEEFRASTERLIHDLEVAHEEVFSQNEQFRHAQELLQRSRDQYAELYEFAPVAYLTLNRDGIIVGANLVCCTLLGVDRRQLVGMPFLGRVVAEDRGLLLEHLRRCRDGASPVVSEMRVQAKDGNTIVVQATSRAASSDAGPQFRTVLTDLTDIKWAAEQVRRMNEALEERVRERTVELETVVKTLDAARERERLRAQELEQVTAELQQADLRKNQFMATLAHELRNPLGPIRSAAELLRIEGLGEADRQESRDVIERQVMQMSRLLDDLLDVSRISRGKMLIRREPVDLARVASEVVRDFRAEAAAAGLTLSADVPADGRWTEGDATRLSQVVANLLFNAVKFNRPGGTIAVKLTSDAARTRHVVEVSDSGIGMSAETCARLFEPFMQADRSLDRSRGGLGLGLALIKGIVELHGGEVAAESAGLGSGSRFTVSLPVCPARPESVASAPGVRIEGALRIVVVDDRRDAVTMLARLLRTMGHDVVTAEDGVTALELAREQPPDVVISDIGLPKMDGYALAAAIRADADLRSVCLIALTGYGNVEDRRRALEAGFDEHFTKPIGYQELELVLANLPASSTAGRGRMPAPRGRPTSHPR